MRGFVMDYLIQFIKYYLVKKHHVSLSKDKRLYKHMETITWPSMKFTSEYYIALRLCIDFLTLYQIYYYLRRLLIKLIWIMLVLHFTKMKRVFFLLFPYPWEFIRLKTLSRSKKKLVFYPPNSNRLLFKGTILKKNITKICSRLASIGVMHMKTYFMWN